MGASEVYTQADKIPSSGLPFNAASHNRQIHQVGGKGHYEVLLSTEDDKV